MRLIPVLFSALAIAGANRPPSDLDTIEQFNQAVQIRFQSLPANLSSHGSLSTLVLNLPPEPALGMNRMASARSFGRPYLPEFDAKRDFEPQTDTERKILACMERDGLQVGFYVFGRAILDAAPQAPNFRALKGPAAITAGTPRPRSYPTGDNRNAAPDALPDWNAIYPLARNAMITFADGGSGYDMAFGSWIVSARPVIAAENRCVACHSPSAFGKGTSVTLHGAVGGVLYAWRVK